MPKVSVVIPTYNRAHLITECIESILTQTFRDFEVIIIDSSTDDTREVVGSFKDPRIRYIYQEKCGQSAAYNAGILASNGEYIAIMDSDDILLKEALEKGIEALDRHPEAAFSYGQAYHMDKDGRTLSLYIPPCKYSCVREGKDEIRELLFGNHISAPVIRKSCLDEVGVFNTNFTVSEDLDLWVRLAKKWPVAYISEPLAKYRIHSNSIMGTITVDEIEKNKSIIMEGIFSDTQLGPALSHLRPKVYFNLYLGLADDAYNRCKMKTSRGYLFQALHNYRQGSHGCIGLRWIYRFALTLVPLPILEFCRSIKRVVNKTVWQKAQRI